MIGPNNREARQWAQVRMDATLRKIEKQRQAALRPILEARKAKENKPQQLDLLTEMAA